MRSHVRFLRENPAAARGFRRGVSLHGHTLHSRESLKFLAGLKRKSFLVRWAIAREERRYRGRDGNPLDFTRAWWTSPVSPHQAWSLEKTQIERTLDRDALVSITDHDDIEAPMRLRVLEECRGVPVSVEWTVPFDDTFFHLGIHGLPPHRARAWMRRLADYTAGPQPDRLDELLGALHADRRILIVWNHPMWDESGAGEARHLAAQQVFLDRYRPLLHALELNGFRSWRENQQAMRLAESRGLPVVAGGDRHGYEPNALLNLTNAACFEEFVSEVRAGFSEVLILRHYQDCLRLRVIQNLEAMLTDEPGHPYGWVRWTDRIFYREEDGRVQSLPQLIGHNPILAQRFVALIRLTTSRHLRPVLRFRLRAGREQLEEGNLTG